MNCHQLIKSLEARGTLRSPAIRKALQEVDRADFVPEGLKEMAYDDTALPIAAGQTISQPYTVVFMLELLNVRPGDKVLDIGFGSGWQSALIAHLVGPSGKVYAFEIVPELCQLGAANLEPYPHLKARIELMCQSAEHGYPAGAPFDRIIAAAEVRTVPSAWREQLAPGGRMVYPKDRALFLEVKSIDGLFETKKFPGFVFVPFIERR